MKICYLDNKYLSSVLTPTEYLLLFQFLMSLESNICRMFYGWKKESLVEKCCIFATLSFKGLFISDVTQFRKILDLSPNAIMLLINKFLVTKSLTPPFPLRPSSHLLTTHFTHKQKIMYSEISLSQASRDRKYLSVINVSKWSRHLGTKNISNFALLWICYNCDRYNRVRLYVIKNLLNNIFYWWTVKPRYKKIFKGGRQIGFDCIFSYL